MSQPFRIGNPSRKPESSRFNVLAVAGIYPVLVSSVVEINNFAELDISDVDAMCPEPINKCILPGQTAFSLHFSLSSLSCRLYGVDLATRQIAL